MIDKLIRVALVVCLVVAVIGFEPRRAVASVPALVVGAAGLAALAACAATYGATGGFSGDLDAAGVDQTTGMMIAQMVGQYKALVAGTTRGQVSTAEVLAVARYLQASGAYTAYQARAHAAGEWLGDLYFDLTGLWDSFGFMEMDIEGVYENSPGAKSGLWTVEQSRAWGSPAPPVNPYEGSLTAEQWAQVVGLVTAMTTNTGNVLKWTHSATYRAGDSWGKVYSTDSMNMAYCVACGTHSASGSLNHIGYDWTAAGWTTSGLTIPLVVCQFLIAHQAHVVTTGAAYSTTFPDGVAVPGSTSVPQHLTVDTLDAQTLTLTPHIVPPVLPPGFPLITTGGLSGLGAGLLAGAGALGVASGLLSGVDLSGVPEGFRQILEWLTAPLVALLNALQALFQWVGQFWANVEAFFFRLFNPNGQQLRFDFEPKFNGLKQKMMLVWPFALLPLVSVIVGVFNDVAEVGGMVQSWSVPVGSRDNPITYTFHLSSILDPITPYRPYMALGVWTWLLIALVRLFRPQVSV